MIQPHPHFKALQLRAKKAVEQSHLGEHLSQTFGEGLEFAELREYQVGDDVRHINWNITARMQKPFVKVHHTHKALQVVVTCLADGAVHIANHTQKQSLMTELFLTLGYATLYNQDHFHGIAFTQNNRLDTTPTQEVFAIEATAKKLFNQELLFTHLKYQEALNTLFELIDTPSLLFIVSDYLQEEINLSHLASKHDVVAVILRSKEEDTLPKLEDVNLLSPIDKSALQTTLGTKSAHKFHNALATHDNKLIAHFNQHHIRHLKLTDNSKIVETLLSL